MGAGSGGAFFVEKTKARNASGNASKNNPPREEEVAHQVAQKRRESLGNSKFRPGDPRFPQ